ncbi:helix-turn-helix domain-containing protein [Nitrospiraceae bacterium AH_259_D15_M11_P09]|nr:helix-turn-helix domain-containing protein [Nitrospiraceae bacterium AH_259_D15_M11_P09]
MGKQNPPLKSTHRARADVRTGNANHNGPDVTKRILTAREAGQYLGFKTAWPVRELVWKGDLPKVQLSLRRFGIDRADLDHFIETRKTVEHIR